MAVGENTFTEKINRPARRRAEEKNPSRRNRLDGGPRQLRPGQSVFALFAAFSTLPVAVKETLVTKHPELLFRGINKDLIRQAAVAENIPSEIALSIIRQNPRSIPGPAVPWMPSG